MGDFGGAVKYLYSNFILRDLLAKVVPGAVVLVGAGVAVTGNTPSGVVYDATIYSSLPTAAVVVLAGAAWTAGFVAQLIPFLVELLARRRPLFQRNPWGLGEAWGDVREARVREVVDRVHIRRRDEAGPENAAGPGRPSHGADALERLTVIREACGNMAGAIVWLGLGTWWGSMNGRTRLDAWSRDAWPFVAATLALALAAVDTHRREQALHQQALQRARQ